MKRRGFEANVPGPDLGEAPDGAPLQTHPPAADPAGCDPERG